MDLAGSCSGFQSDLDFCPDCGSVLPLPGTQDTVICTRCGFSINVLGEGLPGSGPAEGQRGRVAGLGKSRSVPLEWDAKANQGRNLKGRM